MNTRKDIIRRIQALQQRTVERGCSEHEALSAARIAAKLLAEHGLAMSDIEIRERKDCQQGSIETGRKRSHEVVNCIAAIGNLYDCQCWINKGYNVRYVFFGFPEDVEACRTLYNMILDAMSRELVKFKRESSFNGMPTGKRQSHAFLMGMALRIAARLRDIKREQNQETKESTGRDLVIVKGQVVEAQFNQLGLRLGRNYNKSSIGDSQAYQSGRNAGDRVNLGNRKGISSQGYISN